MKFHKKFCNIALFTIVIFSFNACPELGIFLPDLTGTVSITGIPQLDQILTVNTSSLGGHGTIFYQWKHHEGTSTIGTGSSYTVKTGDVGQRITVTVTRTGNTGSKISLPTAIVTGKYETGITINVTSLDEWQLTQQTAQAEADTDLIFNITGDYTAYQWYLDGIPAGTEPVYLFNEPAGIYQLTVVVINSDGDSRSGRCRITVSDSLQDHDKAFVSFFISDNIARTVLPQVSHSDVVLYELHGGFTGAAETKLYEFNSDETEILVELYSGTWNFTLNAYNENDELIFQGKVRNKQIYPDEYNQVDFTLSVINSGNGNIEVIINFPEDAGITEIFADSGAGSENFSLIENGSIVYTKNGVSAGNYLINFIFYSDELVRAVVSELVLVRNSLTSRKTINLDNDDFKTVTGDEIKPELTGNVSIDGKAIAGRTLTANTSELNGIGNIFYQWKRDDTKIGTGSSTYTVQETDIDGMISVTVTRFGYSGEITSDQAGPVLDKGEIQRVTRVFFPGSGQTATVDFYDLEDNEIFLVKVNTSDYFVNEIDTGSVLNKTADFNNMFSYNSAAAAARSSASQIRPVMGRPAGEIMQIIELSDGERSLRSLSAFTPPVVGNVKNFWIETFYDSKVFEQKPATLLATGKHGNIWVIDNSISTAQAKELSDKFDIIYPAATNILGYEYGGKPGHHQPGGRDGDPKIQILVYNIGNNIAGYFWSKDYGTGHGSNNAEIFYIDAGIVKTTPFFAYSTLVHELQHMICYNEKTVERKVSSPTWYNEMLAMMAEDIISDLIGIPHTHSQHIIQSCMYWFLYGYDFEGFTEWLDEYSYETKYAFGAYLLRNFGGAWLLKEIMSNDTVGISSITSALDVYSPGMTFGEALLRFGEAMIFSSPVPDDVLTYDKTVTNTINGITYTAFGFDIWNMARQGGKGPYIYTLSQIEIRPHSITLHSSNAWKNITGNYFITLQKPADPGIQLILMVK